MGDGTTSAVLLSLELLKEGLELIEKFGFHPTFIVDSFLEALKIITQEAFILLPFRLVSSDRNVPVLSDNNFPTNSNDIPTSQQLSHQGLSDESLSSEQISFQRSLFESKIIGDIRWVARTALDSKSLKKYRNLFTDLGKNNDSFFLINLQV